MGEGGSEHEGGGDHELEAGAAGGNVDRNDAGAAGDLIAGLEAEGEIVEDGAGRFRLDVARAREHLREHTLAEPERYACLIVEISVLVGAKLIKFATQDTELHAQFWGAGFARGELEHLADALFVDLGGAEVDAKERRRRRALQLLALAVAGALAAGARSVELRSAGAEGQLLVTREEQGETWSFSALERGAQASGTELRVRFPSSRGLPGLELSGLELSGRELPGLESLRTRCRLSSHPIYLDDQRLSLGPEAGFIIEDGACAATDPVEVLATEPDHDDDRGVIGAATIMTSSVDGVAWIELLTNGWLVERIPLPGGVSGLLAVVELDLRRDLAQAKVIRDEHFEALLEAIRRAQEVLRERAPPAVIVEAPGAAPGLLALVGGGVTKSALLAATILMLALLRSWSPWIAGALFLLVLAFVVRRGWNQRIERHHMLGP